MRHYRTTRGVIPEAGEDVFQGVRQKCGIAIRKEAKVILLHEPTSGLGPKSGQEFCDPARIGRNAVVE